MLLHTCTNILVEKLFGNDLVRRFSYLSLTICGVVVWSLELERVGVRGGVGVHLSV